MKKIIYESFEDVSNYLTSRELIDEINSVYNLSRVSGTGKDICDYVVELVKDNYDMTVDVVKVVATKVVDGEINIIDPNHYVVRFNNYYYDYTVKMYDDSFDNLITDNMLPVVQPTIYSDEQISDRISSLKGYAMLGY